MKKFLRCFSVILLLGVFSFPFVFAQEGSVVSEPTIAQYEQYDASQPQAFPEEGETVDAYATQETVQAEPSVPQKTVAQTPATPLKNAQSEKAPKSGLTSFLKKVLIVAIFFFAGLTILLIVSVAKKPSGSRDLDYRSHASSYEPPARRLSPEVKIAPSQVRNPQPQTRTPVREVSRPAPQVNPAPRPQPRPAVQRRPLRTVQLEELTDDLPNILVEGVAPDNTYEIINALRQVYPSFDGDRFLERVKALYEAIQVALATGNLERIKPAITPALYEQYKRKLSDYERLNQRLILQRASADRAYFFAYRRNRYGETLSIVVDVQEMKYSESTITGMVVNGKKDLDLDLQYFYIFKNVLTPDGKRKWLLSDGGLLNVSMDYGSGGVFLD